MFMYVPLCIESRRQSQRPSEHLPPFLLDGSLISLELNKQAKQAGSEPQPLSTPPAMVQGFYLFFCFFFKCGSWETKIGFRGS